MTSKREFRSTLGTIGPIGAVDAYISKPVQEEEPKEEAPTAQDPAEQKSTKKSTTKEIQKIAENIPEGYRLVREQKTERMHLLVRPGTKRKLKEYTDNHNISMNDLINNLLDDFLENSLNGKVYTLQEVADYLKVSRQTVYNYVSANKLAAHKLGNGPEYRVTEKDLQDFLENSRSI